MATCSLGHQSASDDFCDVCGGLITAAPTLVSEQGSVLPGSGTTVTPGEPCPRCGTARIGQFCESCGYDYTVAGPAANGAGTFSPGSAYSPSAAPPLSAQPLPAQSLSAQAPPGPPPAGPVTRMPPTVAVPAEPAGGADWTAVVSADRAYYDSIQAAGGPDAAAIAFPAYFPQRRFRLTGTEMRIGRHSVSSGINPEIDLSVPPADPGVSRLHAVLLRSPDGTWSVVDPGSANGTVVNGTEIPAGETVPLRDGDRIHLGAWTELRVVRGS